MKALYQAVATTTGGRSGHVKSDDGIIDMDLELPTGLGGKGGEYTNPEQLFAAGYSACFGSALQFVAKENDVYLGDRSEEHTSELQSRENLVCRLLLEKK